MEWSARTSISSGPLERHPTPPHPCSQPSNLHAECRTHGFQLFFFFFKPEALIGFRKRVGSGGRALRPDPTQLCDNSKWIFAIVTLILLPTNQEAALGPISRLTERRSGPFDCRGGGGRHIAEAAVMHAEESRGRGSRCLWCLQTRAGEWKDAACDAEEECRGRCRRLGEVLPTIDGVSAGAPDDPTDRTGGYWGVWVTRPTGAGGKF